MSNQWLWYLSRATGVLAMVLTRVFVLGLIVSRRVARGRSSTLVTVIAVVATSLLRQRLPERLWRGVHWTAYSLWPAALLHG